jgi:hypothetical protein
MSLHKMGSPGVYLFAGAFRSAPKENFASMVMKCRCPSDTHGHKAGRCQALAVTPDKMCQPCHDKVEHELAKPTKQLDESKPSLKLA